MSDRPTRPQAELSADARALLAALSGGAAVFAVGGAESDAAAEVALLHHNGAWQTELAELWPGAPDAPATAALRAALRAACSGAKPPSLRWERPAGPRSFTLEIRSLAAQQGCQLALVQARETAEAELAQARAELQQLQKRLSERKRLEQARRESEAMLGAIFETAGVGLYMTDERGRFVSVNRAFCEMFGYRPEELVGRHFSKLLPPEARDHASERYESSLQGAGSPAHSEYRALRKDGSTVHVASIATPLIRESGRRFQVCSVEDITERREQASLLADRVTEAQREAESKTRLLADLDHKLEIIARQHQQILDLSAPILDLWDGVLALPLIGALDTQRVSTIMERLLAAVAERRTRYVVIDLTSTELIDSHNAEHVIRMVKALQLLGAQGIITGIRPQVAQTLVHLGVDLGKLLTVRSLQEGLRAAIQTGK